MKKLLINGCSFTAGTGFEGEKENPKIWPNLLHKEYFSNYELTNIAEPARNNEWIFHTTVSALIKNHYDNVIVAWTAIPRYNVPIGLELYTTWSQLWENKRVIGTHEHGELSAEFLSDLGNNLRRLHNDHWDILKLVQYVNLLVEIQEKRNGKICFVNSLCPWSRNFFKYNKSITVKELSNFEKNMFNADSRSDTEVIELYNMVHRQYDDNGGIHANKWVNLYKSLLRLRIDQIKDEDFHPGHKSQYVFVKEIKKYHENI